MCWESVFQICVWEVCSKLKMCVQEVCRGSVFQMCVWVQNVCVWVVRWESVFGKCVGEVCSNCVIGN